MKRSVVCCLVVLGLTLGSAGSAGFVENWEFEAGVELFGHHYRESHFMRLDGAQFGVYGSASCLNWDPLIPKLYLSYVGGDITYDGGYQGGGSLKGDVGNSIFNLRPLIGWAFYEVDLFDLEELAIMPYSGICCRYLVNHLEDLGAGGYKRQQTYWYFPLGVEVKFPLPDDDRFSLGIRTELDVMFAGCNKSGSHEYDGQSGWGFQFAPFGRFDVSDKIGLRAELFYRYWKIGESDEIKEGWSVSSEPANATSEYGIKTGVVF